MNHSAKGTKFGKKRGDRRQFLKTLAANCIMHGGIETTSDRALALRPHVEKLITLGKKQTTPALRLLGSRLPKRAAAKVYYELAPRYAERSGGYMRIVKNARARKRDGADTVSIEFVS